MGVFWGERDPWARGPGAPQVLCNFEPRAALGQRCRCSNPQFPPVEEGDGQDHAPPTAVAHLDVTMETKTVCRLRLGAVEAPHEEQAGG